MKKVLFIVPSFMRGGMEIMLVNIANMTAEKADVTIYNLCGHDQGMVEELSEKIHYHSGWTPCKNVLRCGWRNLLLGNFRLFPSVLWYRYHSPEYIYRKIVKGVFDVEIAFFVGEPIKIVAGSNPKTTKRIIWIHSDYSMCGGLFKSFANEKMAIAAMARFHRIVCVSNCARVAFEKVTGIHENLRVIYNYLPVARIRELSVAYEVPYEPLTFCAVCRLVPAKGMDRLIKAARRLNADGFTFRVYIVGDGEQKAGLQEELDRQGIQNVILVGKKDNPYPYISNSDLLVCASRYEGYNLTVAEALILGTPVMSTRCMGPTEILDNGKYGMLVENSEDGIYQGLRKLLADEALLREYRERAVTRQDFFAEGKLRAQLLNSILGEEEID